jgi:myo-inositol-1(or 4)-monophosphatase
MDRAAERLIIDALAEHRPGDHILAEESGEHGGDDDRDDDTVTWLVDPLDGTVNYLYGIPHYAVSLAAQRRGITVAGVVYDVEHDELYAAASGAGATCNDNPLRCRQQADPAFALVATGFGYDAGLRQRQSQVLTQLLPRVRDIRRAGSAALDLCAVAAGRVDAYYEAGMHPWDWGAGALIAAEAGAKVGGLGGGPPSRATTLAANPTLWARLDELLLAAGEPDLAS